MKNEKFNICVIWQAPNYVIWIHMCFNIDIDMDIWIHMENTGLAFPGVGFTGFAGNKYRVQRQAPQDHLPYWAILGHIGHHTNGDEDNDNDNENNDHDDSDNGDNKSKDHQITPQTGGSFGDK